LLICVLPEDVLLGRLLLVDAARESVLRINSLQYLSVLNDPRYAPGLIVLLGWTATPCCGVGAMLGP
jgi:hypothetical protein